MDTCSLVDSAAVALRLIIASTFLFAIWGKSRNFSAVLRALRGSLPVLGATTKPFLYLLLAVEGAAAAAMVSGFRLKVTFAFCAILFLIFTGYLGWLLRSGHGKGCGCFDASEEPVGGVDLLRNALLLSALSWMIANGLYNSPCGASPLWSVPWIVFVFAFFALLVSVGVYLMAIQVQTILRQPISTSK